MTTIEEYFERAGDFKRKGGNPNQNGTPLVAMLTEKEKWTMVRLDYLLSAACSVLNQISDQLADKKVFLQRTFR